uniref:SAM-dependent MTase RsmB/NOP-type domain-containing protein n=1 Tax=Trichuris muris TaxID=70415 RepID=A0A5S6QIY0_TRIMR
MKRARYVRRRLMRSLDCNINELCRCDQALLARLLYTSPWSYQQIDDQLIANIFVAAKCLRHMLSMQEAKRRMEEILAKTYQTREHAVPVVSFHEKVKDVLVISGSGPFSLERQLIEIYVDIKCGRSVLRGADVYPRGLLGSNKIFYKGQKVSVFMDMDGGCRLGWKRPYTGRTMFLGNGICGVNRNDIFRALQNQQIYDYPGVQMTACVWNHPKLYGLIEDWGFPQNLPSIVCGHVLSPQPGECILDLCAAPGGKSAHIACLMGDQGRVVSVDDSINRVAQMRQNISKLSLKSVEILRADVVKLATRRPSSFPRDGFDRVLLDAPCSGLGQRPMLFKPEEKNISSFPSLQKKLFRSAVQLLKPRGTLVYSTCTLNLAENEDLINWALTEYPSLSLVNQDPLIGKGVPFCNGNAALQAVQKFDPTIFCPLHKPDSLHRSSCLTGFQESVDCWSRPADLSVDTDTIGFFIAKMVKTS